MIDSLELPNYLHVDDKGNLTPLGEKLIIKAFRVLAIAAWNNAEAHGFHETDRGFPEEISLIHSEVSEALEEWRDGRDFNEVHYTAKYERLDYKGEVVKVEIPAPQFRADGSMNKPEGIGMEAADSIIRWADCDENRGLDLGERIVEKHRYNVTRPYMHGKKA